MAWVRARFVDYEKGALESTTNTGRHDIAEILLKVALKHHKSNQIMVTCYNSIYQGVLNVFLCVYNFLISFHHYNVQKII
jgi:hypothetical protein